MALGGGGSSGGGGTTTTTSTTSGEIPAELKPAATAAVGKSILPVQERLPLSLFTGYDPASVAPLSPYQQIALETLTPPLVLPTTGLKELANLSAPLRNATASLFSTGEPTAGAQAGVDALIASGRVGPAPTALRAQPLSFESFRNTMPLVQLAETVFPSVSWADVLARTSAPATPLPVDNNLTYLPGILPPSTLPGDSSLPAPPTPSAPPAPVATAPVAPRYASQFSQYGNGWYLDLITGDVLPLDEGTPGTFFRS